MNAPIPSKPRSVLGRLGLSLFFFLFLGMGLLFTVVIVRAAGEAVSTRFWHNTDCHILSSSVDSGNKTGRDENPYRFLVSYSYEINGRGYTGDTYRLRYRGDKAYEDARDRAARFPSGAIVTGYVNPSDPTRAVLDHDSALIGLFILLPLVFVAVGGIGIWAIWSPDKVNAGARTNAAPISASAKGTGGQKIALVVFGFFFVIGGAMTWFLFVRPLLNIVEAQSWIQRPCHVISSRVQTHDGDDGNTYSVDILYAYEVDGREYMSSRYHFFIGSSSGYRGKAAIVKRYPTGQVAVCYVNPRDPTQAVLNRDVSVEFWFGLIPLVFLLIGGGGIVHYMRGGFRPKPVMPTATGTSQADNWSAPLAGPVVLKPKHTPLLRLVGALLICLFWNGIVSVFVWQIIQGFQRGRPEWFLTIFMIPFVLVGLALVGMVIHQFLALFNPRVTLTVSNTSIRPGDTLYLDWQMRGRVGAIGRFVIRLEGREEATFQQGTNTRTDKHTFAVVPIHETDQPLDMMTGHAQVVIPSDVMHSFAAPNNKIIWALHVNGAIRHWPDLTEEFDIIILPKTSRVT